MWKVGGVGFAVGVNALDLGLVVIDGGGKGLNCFWMSW